MPTKKISSTRRRTNARKAATAAPVYTPPARIAHTPFASMSFEEMQAWLISTIDKLQRKKGREKAYLDRRAARGTNTPTDEAYREDQALEQDLLEFLQQCLQINQGRQA